MPSYQATACRMGAQGKAELVASHEFDAPDTPAARTSADNWAASKNVAALGSTFIRLFAGKVLLSERTLQNGAWQEAPRS